MASKRLGTMADRLRHARNVAGVNGRQLDRISSITPGHTSLIESGRRSNLEARTVQRLASSLGLTIDYLLTGVGLEPSAEDIRRAVAKATAAYNRESRKRTGTDG